MGCLIAGTRVVLTLMGNPLNFLQRHNKIQWWESLIGQIQPPKKVQLSKCNTLLSHIFLQICFPLEHQKLAGLEMECCKGPVGGEG